MKLPVAKVYPNPDQPRNLFKSDELRELADSITENGLLQPITVVKRDSTRGTHMIVAGERRWRAHQIAGLTTIQCNVVEMDDDSVDINAIIENVQRVDLTQLEEARAYARIVASGVAPEALAKKLGKRESRVENLLRILSLNADYISLFEKGVLSFRHVEALGRLPPELRPALFSVIRSGKADTDDKIRAYAHGILAAASQATFDLPPPPNDLERNVLSRFERLIERLTATCNEGIADNEIVVLRKIDPHRAAIILEQMALIQNDLARMEKTLQLALAQASVAAMA